MPMAYDGLAKLAEELGELQTVVGKLLSYPGNNHPDGKGDLRLRMEDEMADVQAAMYFVIGKFNLSQIQIQQRAIGKIELYKSWDGE